jgi:hypothetical protein
MNATFEIWKLNQYLNFYKRKTPVAVVDTKIIDEIETLCKSFYDAEIKLIPESDLPNSRIVNIATFNMATLAYTKGIDHLTNLLNSAERQFMPIRFATLAQFIEMKYGVVFVDIMLSRFQMTLFQYYKIDPINIDILINNNRSVWIIPFIQRVSQLSTPIL